MLGRDNEKLTVQYGNNFPSREILSLFFEYPFFDGYAGPVAGRATAFGSGQE